MGHTDVTFKNTSLGIREPALETVFRFVIRGARRDYPDDPAWMEQCGEWERSLDWFINGCMNIELEPFLLEPGRIAQFNAVIDAAVSEIEAFGARVPMDWINAIDRPSDAAAAEPGGWWRADPETVVVASLLQLIRLLVNEPESCREEGEAELDGWVLRRPCAQWLAVLTLAERAARETLPEGDPVRAAAESMAEAARRAIHPRRMGLLRLYYGDFRLDLSSALTDPEMRRAFADLLEKAEALIPAGGTEDTGSAQPDSPAGFRRDDYPSWFFKDNAELRRRLRGEEAPGAFDYWMKRP